MDRVTDQFLKVSGPQTKSHRNVCGREHECLRAMDIKWDILNRFGSCVFVVVTFSQHINISIAQSHNICGIHFSEP